MADEILPLNNRNWYELNLARDGAKLILTGFDRRGISMRCISIFEIHLEINARIHKGHCASNTSFRVSFAGKVRTVKRNPVAKVFFALTIRLIKQHLCPEKVGEAIPVLEGS